MKELTRKLKENKGITLVALIITIIVMLILVGVTVRFTIGENGIIENTKQAKREYKIAQIKDNLAGYSLEYYQKMGSWPSDEALTKIAETSYETGIETDKLVVYYDKATSTEYVLYRYDKTTEEEGNKLKEKGIEVLLGDANLDGFLTEEDNNYIAERMYSDNWDGITDLERRRIADINGNGTGVWPAYDAINMEIVFLILSGRISISDYWENWHLWYGYGYDFVYTE